MATVFKINRQDFQFDQKLPEEYQLKTQFPRLSLTAKSKHLIFDIRQLDPGKYSFPYHWHRNSEELMMIISGSCTLRTKNGAQVIKEGEIIYCEEGEDGAHQFYNHTSEPCIYFDIRTDFGLDIAEQPDSGKFIILPERDIYEKENKAPYLKGEDHLKMIWKELLE
jgi:uncharacterized cupin superfamily protein